MRHWLFFILILLVLLLARPLVVPTAAFAQIERPTDEVIFRDDQSDVQKLINKASKEALKSEKGGGEDLDFKAPTVDFNQETNVISGSGGVVISGRGLQVQAEKAEMDLDTNDAELHGEVLFSAPQGYLSSNEASLNLESETGRFGNGRVLLEEGGYWASGMEILKVSEREYTLFDCRFSTCHCEDGEVPWSFSSHQANITEQGYARLKGGTTFDIFGTPVLYTPYLIFPVKTERASGLLAPKFGYGDEDGFQLRLPIFLAVDDSTDLILTPFTETETRTGLITDFREQFSTLHRVAARMLYSDESARDGDLRGSDVSGLFDPTFDEDRFGGFYKQSWRTEPDSHPFSVVVDGRYVSDDLFLREMDDDDIGKYNSRYVVSRALGSTNIGDYLTAELSSEYSQSIETDDDKVFKRLPEFRLDGLRSVRPFGSNPYGIKLVNKIAWTTTQFYRQDGFDGLRSDIYPGVKVPFHVQNYLNGDVYLEAHQTFYNLDDTLDPEDNTELDDSSDRLVPQAGASIGTALERVFALQDDSWLATVAGLGKANQDSKLVRVKHGIEPTLFYSYVPEEEQDDLPLFDSLDRIRKKSVFTFNLRNALYGRYDPTLTGGGTIEELTPRIDELPVLGFDRVFGDYGAPEQYEMGARDLSGAKGEIREVVTFDLQQSYDYFEDVEDNDPEREEWSDLGGAIEVFPNRNFRVRFDSNYNYDEAQFSTYGVVGQLVDDRGDALRARLSYTDNQISQIDGNAELAISRRLRIGYYGNYDSIEDRFLNHKAALRILSACNCWKIDLGYLNRLNPDKQGFGVTFTLAGLGDIGS